MQSLSDEQASTFLAKRTNRPSILHPPWPRRRSRFFTFFFSFLSLFVAAVLSHDGSRDRNAHKIAPTYLGAMSPSVTMVMVLRFPGLSCGVFFFFQLLMGWALAQRSTITRMAT